MTTITNSTGTKAVKITASFFALYIQIYKSEEQVLESKRFSSQEAAEKWAKKMLA